MKKKLRCSVTVISFGFLIGVTTNVVRGADILEPQEITEKFIESMKSRKESNENISHYLDNTSDFLPVRIERTFIASNDFGEFLSYTAKNYTVNDIKNITYGLVAWDENYLPVVVNTYAYDDGKYITDITSNSIGAQGYDEDERAVPNIEESKYIHMVVLEYEDFEGNVWRNPDRDFYEKECAGQKLSKEIMNRLGLNEEDVSEKTEDETESGLLAPSSVEEDSIFNAEVDSVFAPAGTSIPEPEYILPDSSSKILVPNDLKGISIDDMQMAINEIYARHGRKFKDADIQAYFDSMSWYREEIEPEQFDDGVLNKYERSNINTIVEMIDSRSGVGSEELQPITDFAGEYYMETADAGVSLLISVYTDVSYENLQYGDAYADMEVGIRMGSGGMSWSNGSLLKNEMNEYIVSGGDLDGATLKVIPDGVTISGTGGADGTYSLVEKYYS